MSQENEASPKRIKQKETKQISDESETSTTEFTRGEIQLRSRIVGKARKRKTSTKRSASTGRVKAGDVTARTLFLEELQKLKRKKTSSEEEQTDTVAGGIENEEDSQSEEIIQQQDPKELTVSWDPTTRVDRIETKEE